MPPTSFDGDIAIIGAGPDGTTAAALLARAGRDVHVFDRATFPRDKCCGDGLTTLALRELEALGFDPSTVASWQRVDDVVIRSPRGTERRYALPEGEGYHAQLPPVSTSTTPCSRWPAPMVRSSTRACS